MVVGTVSSVIIETWFAFKQPRHFCQTAAHLPTFPIQHCEHGRPDHCPHSSSPSCMPPHAMSPSRSAGQRPTPHSHSKQSTELTYRFISPSPSLIPTKFLIIRPIMSSRQTTTSCPKYRILHGLLTNLALATLWVNLCEKTEGRAGRGRVEEDQGSKGPGTNMKCEESRRGNWSRRSVRALKPAI